MLNINKSDENQELQVVELWLSNTWVVVENQENYNLKIVKITVWS